MKKKFYIESLGCPKNLVDSEVFAFIAERNGYLLTDDAVGADLVLVNTCSFLQASVDELHAVLAEIIDLKTDKQIKKLVITGCIMNRYAEEIRAEFPQIDAFIGLKDFAAFESLISKKRLDAYHRTSLYSDSYTYLRISDGCSNHCSYCTIPSIRGELLSRPMEEIIAEAQYLAEQDFVELILIAQDLSAYGLDLYGKLMLPELLQKLHEIEGFDWIRLMYLHPVHITSQLVDTIAALPKILHSFEMPLQHVNDDILQKMNRPYTKQDIISVLNMFKAAMPDCVFRTTFITGFPGETPKQFAELKQFSTDYPFLRLGAFAYSPEEGTPAVEMPNRVSNITAEKRQQELLTHHRKLTEEYLNGLVGKQIPVLVEEAEENEQTVGRAWFDAPDIDGLVFINACGLQPGQIIKVEIDDVIDIDLFGSEVFE
jgi:ribosomal protein S12 methylthiotransferase